MMTGKISIYQVLPRLFGNTNDSLKPNGTLEENGSGKFDDFTDEVLRGIKGLGVTHVWYTGVLDHATGTDFPGKPATQPEVLKGIAGSPYAVRDYYDVAPELAVNPENREEEFRALIERTHKAQMKVVIDFVPNHVSRVYHSLRRPPLVRDLGADDKTDVAFDKNNNYYYIPGSTLIIGDDHADPVHGAFMEFPAKATGNDVFTPYPSEKDWYETVKLNYGWDPYTWQEHYESPVPDTWNKMLDILLYWCAMGVDAFRCDMAGMVPVPFWKWVIGKVHLSHPETEFVAELYEPIRYKSYIEAGFDYLYDKVGLYDTLVGVLKGQTPASAVSDTWKAVEGLSGHLLHFMENHDEQRLASDFISGDGRKAFPAMALSALIDSSGIMTYFGQELGERGMDEEGFSGRDGRTTIFDYWSVPAVRLWKTGRASEEILGLREKYTLLLNLAINDPVFGRGQFFDLMYANVGRFDFTKQYAFLRSFDQEVALVVVNFDDKDAFLEIKTPELALDMFGLHKGMVGTVKNPISGDKGAMELNPEYPYQIEVPALGVAIRCFRPVV